LSQAIVVLTLFSYYRAGGWTLDSVGVSKRVTPMIAFLTGLGEFGLFTLLTQWTFAFFGSPFAYLQSATRANAVFAPGGRVRCLAMTSMGTLINPVAEEVMFRGLLVYQLVVVGSPVWLALLVGALVNAANHSYQGRLEAAFHLAFYAAAVGLLFSPVGLVGAIGFHFGGDLLPVIQYRAQLRAYRAARRARRSNSGLQQTPPSLSLGRRS
jgi:membrane protease YdiL (CAAX protease family)